MVHLRDIYKRLRRPSSVFSHKLYIHMYIPTLKKITLLMHARNRTVGKLLLEKKVIKNSSCENRKKLDILASDLTRHTVCVCPFKIQK